MRKHYSKQYHILGQESEDGVLVTGSFNPGSDMSEVRIAVAHPDSGYAKESFKISIQVVYALHALLGDVIAEYEVKI